ncbi:TadE/TadG family type IV pilus assembly protein [Micromonospora sp. DT4]|uniref:TadE/TadG family type IV pilus assembly protein n=1 Tax=Micromonospora sp. DT4 TaxID=3393438 RepID=UPI003CE8E12E
MKTIIDRLRRDDQGSMSIFVGVFAMGILVLLMVVWDAGSQVRAMQNADNIAAQAARTAGQQIDIAEAIAGGDKHVDPVKAQAAAQAYLAAAGVTGTVTFSPDLRQVTVTTSLAYQPNFAGLPYRGPATISGRATAQLITG